MSYQFKIIIFLVGCVVSNMGFTACVGKIDAIQHGYNGRVSIISAGLYGDAGARDICRVDTAWDGVPVGACKAWLSTLLVAYVAGKEVWVQYPGDVACSSIPTWENASRPHAIKIR